VGVPTAAEVDRDHVFADIDKACDIKAWNVYSMPRQDFVYRIARSLKIGGKRQKRIGIDAFTIDVTLEKAKPQYIQRYFFDRAYMEISAKNGKSYWGSFGSSNPYGTFKKIGFFHNRNTSSVFDLFAKESEAQF
jgi:hypothetical protein